MFSRDWVSVGRASALKAPGDYIAYELAGQPIVVLRDGEGRLRAMSNVCRHRMSTLVEGQGSARALVCPYHGWTYNLDGTLRGAPAMSRNEGFCKEDYKLPAVRCEEWLGWIMVTLNPDAAAGLQPARRGGGADRGFRHGVLCRDLPRDPPLGHQLEGARREFHGELSPAGLPCRHHRRALAAGGYGLPAGRGDVQLPHDPEGRFAEDRAGASAKHAAEGRPPPHHIPAVDLPEPADHADAGLFLVSERCTRTDPDRSTWCSAAACRRTSPIRPRRSSISRR